ncbi:MAG: GDSL-type esterase/lipase family protein [Desulfosporosinus sp.]|nr:GDSL-type esterase/lipase family protein [Desulfosporosinus sp.]
MYKQKLWYISIGITVISLAVIMVGFVKAMNFAPVPATGTANSTPQNASTAANEPASSNHNLVHVLLMGDSIAKGTGDEKGKGIGGYLVDLLKSQTPKDIKVDNVAVDGYKIDDLDALLKSGKQDNMVSSADFLIISIGGSDLQEIQSLKDKEQTFQTKQDTHITELKEIVNKIRTLNKKTQIIVIGSYNPISLATTSDNITYLDTWNYNSQLVLSNDDKATFIPTYDMFKNNLNRFISSDKLNPNSTGYQTIAYLISKAVENTLGKP